MSKAPPVGLFRLAKSLRKCAELQTALAHKCAKSGRTPTAAEWHEMHVRLVSMAHTVFNAAERSYSEYERIQQ